MRGQRGAVLKHLVVHGDITSKQAFELYGCTRLAAVIFNFREMGYKISTIDEHGKNRFNEATRYARYVLSNDQRKEMQEKHTIGDM